MSNSDHKSNNIMVAGMVICAMLICGTLLVSFNSSILGGNNNNGSSGGVGVTGAQGPIGIQGLTGPIGPQGPAGANTGTNGTNGSNGSPGANGANGTSGSNGAPGINAAYTQPYSYLIYVNGSNYMAQNGSNGQIVTSWTSTNPTTVINTAWSLGNTVFASGDFYLPSGLIQTFPYSLTGVSPSDTTKGTRLFLNSGVNDFIITANNIHNKGVDIKNIVLIGDSTNKGAINFNNVWNSQTNNILIGYVPATSQLPIGIVYSNASYYNTLSHSSIFAKNPVQFGLLTSDAPSNTNHIIVGNTLNSLNGASVLFLSGSSNEVANSYLTGNGNGIQFNAGASAVWNSIHDVEIELNSATSTGIFDANLWNNAYGQFHNILFSDCLVAINLTSNFNDLSGLSFSSVGTNIINPRGGVNQFHSSAGLVLDLAGIVWMQTSPQTITPTLDSSLNLQTQSIIQLTSETSGVTDLVVTKLSATQFSISWTGTATATIDWTLTHINVG